MQFISRRSTPLPVFALIALLFCVAPLQGNVSVTAAPQPTSLFLLSEATILGLALWRRSKNQRLN